MNAKPSARPTADFFGARFGIFLHYGLYTLIGENENAVRRGPKDRYAALMKRFNPVKFNADEWVAHFADAGASYIVPTAKHAEGFCLWNSRHTPFNVTRTPFKRDLLEELAAACARRSLRMGLYYNANTWLNQGPDGRELTADNYADFVQAQLEELLTGYGPIFSLWFDHSDPLYTERDFRRWLSMMRRLQPDCVVNDRGLNTSARPAPGLGDFVTPERHIPDHLAARHPFIECCDAITARSWGYQREGELISSPSLIRRLSSAAALGGNFLLNVSPLPDGQIQEGHLQRLRDIGEWMRTHREAVFGTTGGTLILRDPATRRATVRSTQADSRTLYLHLHEWPETDQLILKHLSGSVTRATLLNSDARLRVKPLKTAPDGSSRGLRLCGLPPTEPARGVAVVRLRFREPPRIDTRAMRAERFPPTPLPSGETVRLSPRDAEYNSNCGIPWQNVHTYPNGNLSLCHWVRAGCFAHWKLTVEADGTYDVFAELGTSHMQRDADFEIRVDGSVLQARTVENGWYDTAERLPVGRVRIRAGRRTLTLAVRTMPAGAFSDVHGIVLQPVPQP